jgi:hypothetical protein
MFTREHHIGRQPYIEALERYRDPDTGRVRHRCLARWRAERSFAHELGLTRFWTEEAARNLVYWQGVIDRTVQPRVPKHRNRATECVKFWQRRLDIAAAHFAELTAARDAGLPVDDAEIERAALAEADRWARAGASTRMLLQPPSLPGLTGLAEWVRELGTRKYPDALRADIAAIAADLDALGPRS